MLHELSQKAIGDINITVEEVCIHNTALGWHGFAFSTASTMFVSGKKGHRIIHISIPWHLLALLCPENSACVLRLHLASSDTVPSPHTAALAFSGIVHSSDVLTRPLSFRSYSSLYPYNL